jgi:dephospho-CoA kinase
MIVGLTGGIGSGKSTVAAIFQYLKVPVFIADEEAKALIDQEPIQRPLKALLGADIIKSGAVNRSLMAQKIFGDESLLKAVNNIIHPAVGQRFQAWAKEQDHPYLIREAAILFESGSYRDCEKIIVVTAPEALRLKRVMKRSGEGEEQVKRRMSRQWPEEEKIARADYVITNDHSQSLIYQVLAIHEDLISRANS